MNRPDLESCFDGLLDDAALFPPGNADMAVALEAFQRRRATAAARFVGPFVATARRLPEMAAVVRSHHDEDQIVDTSVILDVDPAWHQLPASIRVVGVDVPFRAGRTPDDLMAITGAYPGLPVFVEVGWGPEADHLAEAALDAGAMLKLRTGGTTAAAFPSAARLAAMMTLVARRQGSYKCTAGLHNAVRHDDQSTGFRHHGFLNVLVAASGAMDGDTETILETTDGKALAQMFIGLSPHSRAVARTRFRSFGTCSISEPLDDLSALRLIAATHASRAVQ